jgi:hypothetical protein
LPHSVASRAWKVLIMGLSIKNSIIMLNVIMFHEH